MTKKSINRGRQLKFIREYRGYSQKYIAERIDNLSQCQISKFECGFETIKEYTLRQIMILLDWPFEFIDKNITKQEVKL